MHSARRTIVKSPPEIWAEVSDPQSLARHLGAFGEIRITRLETEATVAWEGDRVRGTVDLTSSGWGTKVTLTAEPVEMAEAEAEAEPQPVPEPVALDPEPPPAPRRGFWARMFGRPAPAAPDPPQPEAVTVELPAVTAAGPGASLEPGPVLDGMLDALGAAHHRPFTR
jgi:hypothetical protein